MRFSFLVFTALLALGACASVPATERGARKPASDFSFADPWTKANRLYLGDGQVYDFRARPKSSSAHEIEVTVYTGRDALISGGTLAAQKESAMTKSRQFASMELCGRRKTALDDSVVAKFNTERNSWTFVVECQ